MKFCLVFAISFLLFTTILSEEIIFFESTDTIEFAKISEYEIKMKDFKNKIDMKIFSNSYLIIKVEVEIDKNCLENKVHSIFFIKQIKKFFINFHCELKTIL